MVEVEMVEVEMVEVGEMGVVEVGEVASFLVQVVSWGAGRY